MFCRVTVTVTLKHLPFVGKQNNKRPGGLDIAAIHILICLLKEDFQKRQLFNHGSWQRLCHCAKGAKKSNWCYFNSGTNQRTRYCTEFGPPLVMSGKNQETLRGNTKDLQLYLQYGHSNREHLRFF